MTDDQIKHMVDRFLGWHLPEDFNPDAGISFQPAYNNGTPQGGRHEPTGTNLFDARQAEAMVRYMIDGVPSAQLAQREPLPAADDDPPCTDCDGTGITKQTERRCSCQPPIQPELLPEDVEAIKATIDRISVELPIGSIHDAIACAWTADRQRAVEAAVAEIQRRITREMDHADLHGMEDAALVDNIHGAVWNYVDEIRARGAAQEKE